MSDDSSSSYRIEPLTADNYHTWRTQMTDILAELELWENVTGAIEQPSDTNLQAAWRKKDAKALRAIRLRVAKDALVYVQDAKTSKEAWDTLAETFQETGPIGIIEARRKLFRAQCAEGADIEEHLRKLRGYLSELHALGQTVSDADFAFIILTSLPESWNPFIRAIDPTDLTETEPGKAPRLTSAKLITRILQEDHRGKHDNDNNTALKATDKSKITCYSCGRRGHYARECHSRSHSGQRHNRDPRRDQDQDRNGSRSKYHSEHNPCPNDAHANVADDSDSDGGEMPARQVTGTIWMARMPLDASDDTALAAYDPDTYFLDSGATTHVIRDRTAFRDYVATPGRTIHGVGGHEIAQLGHGTVALVPQAAPQTPITLRDAAHVPAATHNLVSVARITESGGRVSFKGNLVEIRDGRGHLITTGKKYGRLYRLDVTTSSNTALATQCTQFYLFYRLILFPRLGSGVGVTAGLPPVVAR
ncbi:hypothetical protein BN946_scf185002.g131 [Trametes cinnabarina]|uniref:CCHC-type domain-containing protein n=1 Tax=Pycnoporus cinnabarinus TaxID=5643 RepID=A0A060SFG8_PYCCI|nr:hypothetical protein BN946_scf185002.g131 [Trametes cinnabarina]